MSKTGHFGKYAIGFVIGTVTPAIIKSGVGQNALRYLTAGGFIVKNGVMSEVEKIQSSSLDIAEDAKEITERYYKNMEKKAEAENCEEEEA